MKKFPIFVEDSKVPVLLSKLAPIEIHAISLGLVVFCRSKFNDRTRVHETIHYRQWLELLFIGFLVLYPAFWIWNILKGMSGEDAYRNIPFEKEAWDNDRDMGYLFRRKPFAWARKDDGDKKAVS
jgi:hypothetical protein